MIHTFFHDYQPFIKKTVNINTKLNQLESEGYQIISVSYQYFSWDSTYKFLIITRKLSGAKNEG